MAWANSSGFLLTPVALDPQRPLTNTSVTIDATDERQSAVGQIWLSTGPGTSKTFDSSCFVVWQTDSPVTFANAGTTLRVGVQDVTGGTVTPDGTFDVYADLVGGTDTISAVTLTATQMVTGSKTITHGDTVAIMVHMTARGGSDSVPIARSSASVYSMPTSYGVISGIGSLASAVPPMALVFADGTVGWFEGIAPWAFVTGAGGPVYNLDSTPDEYALVFQIPAAANALGLFARMSPGSSLADFELILYSDPLGTPVAERVFTHDAGVLYGGNVDIVPFTTAYALAANTSYAVALRPLATADVTLYTITIGNASVDLRPRTVLGTNWSTYTRSGNTGAFGSQDTYTLPLLGVVLGAASGGGGGALIDGRLVRS